MKLSARDIAHAFDLPESSISDVDRHSLAWKISEGYPFSAAAVDKVLWVCRDDEGAARAILDFASSNGTPGILGAIVEYIAAAQGRLDEYRLT